MSPSPTTTTTPTTPGRKSPKLMVKARVKLEFAQPHPTLFSVSLYHPAWHYHHQKHYVLTNICFFLSVFSPVVRCFAVCIVSVCLNLLFRLSGGWYICPKPTIARFRVHPSHLVSRATCASICPTFYINTFAVRFTNTRRTANLYGERPANESVKGSQR